MFTNQHSDNFDITSDNLSESCSNLSSLSGLTGYEEELYSLRKLTSEAINDNQVILLESEIKQLKTELHKLRENYKAELANAERRIELAFHERFEKLLQTNSHLENQLTSLSKGSNSKEVELHCKVNSLNNELIQCRNELGEKESERCKVTRSFEETKLDLMTKTSTVDALKSKIVSLHLELSGIQQENIRSNNSLQIALNELNSFKKSENWYKEQLKEYRSQKSENLKEISRLHALLISKDHELDLQNSNVNNFKNTFEEFKLAASYEKENLLKTIAQLQTDSSQIVCNSTFDDYESMIEGLNRELKSLKDVVAEQQRLNKEHSEIVSSNTTLRSLLEDKEVVINNLEAERDDQRAKIDFTWQQWRDTQNLLVKTVGEKCELQAVLDGTVREKEEIQEAVKNVREKFSVLIGNYNKIKQELALKESEIEELTTNFKNERKSREQHLKLQEELQRGQEKLYEVEKINLSLQNVNLQLGNETREYKQKLQEAVNKIRDLEKCFYKKDEQILNLTQTSESFQKLTEELKKSTQDLEKERLNLFQNNESLNSEVMSLENEVVSLKSKVRSLARREAESNEYISLPKSNGNYFINNLAPIFSDDRKISLTDKIVSAMSSLNGLSVNFKKQEAEMEETCSIEEKVLNQFKMWREKCSILKNKEDEVEQMKNKLQNVLSQKAQLSIELKEVKSLLKAKELEMEEKRKRYEVNNRTLLKKIKEHMRGRNAAEKRCAHLEELHNEAFDQLNSYKLRQSEKDEEIQNLQSILENYNNINRKHKQELLSMEKKLKGCDEDCDQLKMVKDRINQLLDELKDKEAKIKKIAETNSTLQTQNSSLLVRVEVLSNELKLFTKSTSTLQEAYDQQLQLAGELRTKLMQEESENFTQTQLYQQNLSQTEERNKFLAEEVQILSAELKQTKSDLMKFEELKIKLESSWTEREHAMQLDIKQLREELNSIGIDKNFLQRLCNDLKITLKMALNYNKALKDQLKTPSQAVLNLPSPSHCNNERINDLIKQLNGIPSEQPMSKLQYSLNSLKKEMASLRLQISKQCTL